MNKRRFFRDLTKAVMDPERDITERLFLCIGMASWMNVLLALIGDIFLGENLVEIATLAAISVLVPVLIFVGLYKDRLKMITNIIVLLLVLVILPLLFFFGGGVEGGGVLWIVFAFLYAGLVLSGKMRTLIFFMQTVISIICYWLAYTHPELVQAHSREMFYVDSLISILLVGIVCFSLSIMQKRLFEKENVRARQEAKKAEELTRAQNRFFSSMSHEIRTPINSILGLNELILREPGATEGIVKDAAGIQGAGKMLLSLINDILDFSKMEAGSMDIVPVDYSVGKMLSEIVNMMWMRAQDKGLNLDVSVDPGVPSVLYGDEVRIKQVIINLLNNAVKYTVEGSVELHIECDIEDDDTAQLRIVVTDTGIGIKKEAIPYLFDAFKRVDQEKNRMIEGTGLGLSIVKQIVELMGGSVSVSSVYGEGSAFTVVLRQKISDFSKIGELNIHNQVNVKRHVYESSFKAPEAAILIVDDNEMNLEVESRLLSGTGMLIDKAVSGKEALERTLQRRYDVILMDHLMPEMDGIECMERLRQQGGLNRTTAVLVLTANAGSENRELYKRSGFDGYLVKPVSGEMLEEALIRHIPQDKLIINGRSMSMHEDINAGAAYTGKLPVLITSTSMCDLPDRIVRKLGIQILPFKVYTDEGEFKDGAQMDGNELVRYISRGGNAVSDAPDEASYTEFFAAGLKKAHHLIHIALTTSMSVDYKVSSEAAKAFENVSVINSECISSATGILVLMAQRLVQQNIPVEEIIEELETVKKRLMCSFVIDTTDYMVRRKLVSPRIHKLAGALNLHPAIRMRNDKIGIGGIWMGNAKRAYRNYIKKAFPADVIPDSEVVFITYVDLPMDTLLWIREEISRIAYFEHVVFRQASAAISSNCGPGAFGVLYFVKSNKSYNLGAYFEEENEELQVTYDEEEPDEPEQEPDESEQKPQEQAWYRGLEGIDADMGLKNSGSEESFKTVLKIFYESIKQKTGEIESFYSAEDWKNYTVKVHALKSSAKLIGAMELSEAAQKLENAGKETDLDYIRANHNSFMKAYTRYSDVLTGVFAQNESAAETEDKPLADDSLIQSVYEGIQEAAEAMDCDRIDEILAELDEYAAPESEREKIEAIRLNAGNFDYDGILQLFKDTEE